MADESKIALPQAAPTGAPAPTPGSVKMEGVKSIIGGVDIASVTGTGDLYVKMASRLVEHADNLVAHAEALAAIWRGPNADLSLQAFSQLHTATTTISTNVAAAGETYKWLGTTILPFYKDSAQNMTDGFIRTDGDDENARQLLDRMNDRVAEANNGLPNQLTVVFPEVKGMTPPDDGMGVPPSPGGYTPSGIPGPKEGGLWTPGGYDEGLYAGVPTGPEAPTVPAGPGGPTVPGGLNPVNPGPGGLGPTNPGGPGGLGPMNPGNVIGPGLPGNGTDLASSLPYQGPNQNAFNLTPTGPTPGLPGNGPTTLPSGPGPLTAPAPSPGHAPSTPAGPRGVPVRTTPGGMPRTALSQGPNGVIGGTQGQSALASRSGQQAGMRGGMLGGSRGGGSGPGEGEEHTRTTWLSEDEEVWGTDADVPPSVIG
ncbi:hypothetical protein [Actinocorallia libanotica]|uniref:PPE family protein n=1 Tax=Actinocorallia libanotica TaxID=46162 RepID=A0ABP4CE57_9ACTN